MVTERARATDGRRWMMVLPGQTLSRSRVAQSGTRGRHAQLLLTLLAVWIESSGAVVKEKFYDCQLRKIALDYSREVVLAPWVDRQRAASALAHVSEGLQLSECNFSLAESSAAPAAAAAPLVLGEGSDLGMSSSVTVHVATTGDDTGPGSANSPLRTIAGAQAWIRTKYPTVSTRPQITVKIAPGDYLYGAAPPGHIKNSTLYSRTAIAHFSAQDSGSSAAKPVIYADRKSVV